jgi:predicted dehydrogenase
MAADKIRVGIIGANAHYGWSMRAHLPALRAMPDYELTAVCTSTGHNLRVTPNDGL